LEGNYKGSFSKVISNSDYENSTVDLTLESGRFLATSGKQKYPAICSGTYEIVCEEIRFTNECPWTAEFDWTLILNGNFKFTRNNGSLARLKKESGNYSDIYLLTNTN